MCYPAAIIGVIVRASRCPRDEGAPAYYTKRSTAMLERHSKDIEYAVRQEDGVWVWEITENGKVIASGCSPTEAEARTQAFSRRTTQRTTCNNSGANGLEQP